MSDANHFDGTVQCEYFEKLVFHFVNSNHVFHDEFQILRHTKMSLSNFWFNFFFFQSILKAYLKGIWDSVKGVSLIYIVIRDTYNHDKNQSKKGECEADESSSSSNTTTSISNRANRPNRRELNKLKE